jgi:hypothetical protein
MGNKLIQEDAINLHNTKKLGGYADAMLYLFANKGARIARIGWRWMVDWLALDGGILTL